MRKVGWVKRSIKLRPGLSGRKYGSKVQYWQLIDIPRPISSYCFYKDICPSPNLYPSLLQLPILHLYGEESLLCRGGRLATWSSSLYSESQDFSLCQICSCSCSKALRSFQPTIHCIQNIIMKYQCLNSIFVLNQWMRWLRELIVFRQLAAHLYTYWPLSLCLSIKPPSYKLLDHAGMILWR